jgi:16S rRNA (guanine966-N2)-methyltransferase
MSVLAADLEGASVLDLFAGSGALGLEALSRGARHATFVERDARALHCLRANIAALGAEDLVTLVAGDVFDYLEGLAAAAFDVALADPPYGRGLASRLIERYLHCPFTRILSVEHDPGEGLSLPPGSKERRYGDTSIAFIAAALEERGT